jgi:lipoate-protein ligase A
LSQKEKEEVQALSGQKYETTEWRFGYSPPYIFENSVEINRKTEHIRLKIERGSISEASLNGNIYGIREAVKLENLLTGRPHLYESVEKAHTELNIPYNEDLIYGYF